MDGRGPAERVEQEPDRAAGDDGDEAEPTTEIGEQLGHRGQRAGGRRVVDDGGQRAVVVEEEGRPVGMVPERRQDGRKVGQPVVVVVTWDDRSGPTTTTTSAPVVPLTGTDVVSGWTTDGFRPSEAAMAAAGACWPDA